MTIANIASIASSMMAQSLQSASHHRGGGHHGASSTQSASQSQNSSTQISSLSSMLNVIPKSSMSPAQSLASMPGFSMNSSQSQTNVVV